jgi:hypothetical protein
MESKTNFNLYLSYSHKDIGLVKILGTELSNKGINLLFDQNLINDGVDWKNALMEGMRKADGILVLLTQNSIDSKYVMNELGMARAFTLESKEKKVFLPVIYGNIEIPLFIQDIQAIMWRDSFDEVIDRITKAVYNFVGNRDNLHTDIKADNIQSGEEYENLEIRNFWLLKMNPETWQIELLRIGETTYFSPYYFKQKRPEFKILENIKKGDYVLGFAAANYQSIICLMEVTDPYYPDDEQGIVIKMKVKKLLTPRIHLITFRNKIQNILPKLEQNSIPPELFFSLPENLYKSILTSDLETVKETGHTYQPFYLTEGNHIDTDDQLQFENDIDSFAAVIALERVEPPLAIGLFGNWGSGKSFFMEKLSERIEEKAASGEPEYIHNVVQVKFNSWHYSDTNLWASLITQIFESLHDYAINKKFGAEAIKSIYKDLDITSHQLEETQKKLVANDAQYKVLQEQKEDVEETIRQKRETLSIWTAQDLIKVVYSDSYIKQDFENIKKQFETDKLIENIDQVEEKIDQLHTVRRQIFEAFSILKKNHKGKWIWVWILLAFFALGTILVLGPFREIIHGWTSKFIVVLTLFISSFGNAIAKLSPWFSKISQFYRRIKSLKETIDKEKEKVKLKEHDEIARLNQEITGLISEKVVLEMEQGKVVDKKAKLENEITEIGSGRMLANFLASKSTDNTYIKQLGVISWIRRDFSKLNDLFMKQKGVQEQEKELKTEFQIDRIVLYIDDLDRCNEEVVVKVLEAIHLLLAFPLFVVVVGVDPRWLNNALSEKYKHLFGYKEGMVKKEANKESKVNSGSEEETLLISEAATSYDYLEKIFQIPFALKPINKTGRENLIKYLIRKEIASETGSTTLAPNDLPPIGNENEASNPETPPLAGGQTNDQNPNAQSEDDKHQKAKEKLVFTSEELSYMQKISALYGKTPRSINRYVNIYRIIKAHGTLEVLGTFSKEEFMPVLFILGVIVGYSHFAKEFIEKIDKAMADQKFKTFLELGGLNEKIVAVVKPLSIDINELTMQDFKRNLGLISRFSFRTMLLETN